MRRLKLLVVVFFLTTLTPFAQTSKEVKFETHGPMWFHAATMTLDDGNEYVAVRMVNKAYMSDDLRMSLLMELSDLNKFIKEEAVKQANDN